MNTFPQPPPRAKECLVIRPQPGRGTLLTVFGEDFAISAAARGAWFRHPFQPLLLNNAIQLSKGLVEVFEPKIGRVPISGDTRNAAPRLKLDAKTANAAGESWVCLEVEPGAQLSEGGEPQLDASGKPQLRATLDGLSRVEIVHRAEPLLFTAAIGRCPLVLVVWNGTRVARLFPIVHFNLRYHRVDPPAGSGAVRHLFF